MTGPLDGGWGEPIDTGEDPQEPSEAPGGSTDMGEAPEGPQSAAEGDDAGEEGDQGPQEAEEQPEDDRKGESKFRRQAREAQTALTEAQTELTELRGRVSMMQGAEAARLAGEYLSDPGDLFVLGGGLDEVLNEQTGTVDPAAVKAVCERIVATRPGLAKGVRVATPSFAQGDRGKAPQAVDFGMGWSNVIKGRPV